MCVLDGEEFLHGVAGAAKFVEVGNAVGDDNAATGYVVGDFLGDFFGEEFDVPEDEDGIFVEFFGGDLVFVEEIELAEGRKKASNDWPTFQYSSCSCNVCVRG